MPKHLMEQQLALPAYSRCLKAAAYVQPAGCARRDIGHGARGVHRSAFTTTREVAKSYFVAQRLGSRCGHRAKEATHDAALCWWVVVHRRTAAKSLKTGRCVCRRTCEKLAKRGLIDNVRNRHAFSTPRRLAVASVERAVAPDQRRSTRNSCRTALAFGRQWRTLQMP